MNNNSFYVKLSEEDEEFFMYLMKNECVDYEITHDPMKFVCDELADSYIESNVESELKPIYRKYEKELSEYLYKNIDVDGNTVIELLNDNNYIQSLAKEE